MPVRRFLLLAALVAAPALAQRAAPRGPAAPGAPPLTAMPPAAAEHYHEAARLYIDGKNAPALAAAEAAVALAPDDARAVALRDLIRKQQDDQNQQDQQNPSDQNQDGQQPPPPDDSGQNDPQNNPGQNDSGQNGQTPPPPGGDAGQPKPDEMSRDQAERILDAVGGDERLLLRQMRRPPSRVRTNEEDW